MATEMVTYTFCDVCLDDDGQKTKADSFEWDGANVDLCPDHAEPLMVARALFDNYGASGKRTKTQARQAGPVDPQTCPVCGATSKNKVALMTHVRQRHQTTLGKLAADKAGEKLAYKCSVCGKEFSTPQGAGAHRARSHPGAKSA